MNHKMSAKPIKSLQQFNLDFLAWNSGTQYRTRASTV